MSKKVKRFSLALISKDSEQIVKEFKEICKKEKKRYSNTILYLLKDYNNDYKAVR